MSNNFIVEKSTVDRFSFVVYATDAESVLSSLGKIQAELSDVEYADVLFDTLLYAGNTKDRFIKATLINGTFDMDSFEVIDEEKGGSVREMAKAFFDRHKKLVRLSSILNSVQRTLLLNGVAI